MDRDKLDTLHDLTGRVAIVTGGTRGIGKAIAEGFGSAGATIAVASRKTDACEATVAHLASMGIEAIGVPAHMGNLDAIADLVDETVGTFGRIDIVVNGAANALALPLGHLTEEGWSKSLDTNLRGPAFLVERALPHLEASGNAAVLNIISAAAFLFNPHGAMYSAGKAGLMGLTRSMAAAFASKGIRVNALAPGTVMTDMVMNNTPEAVESMQRASFMGRGADLTDGRRGVGAVFRCRQFHLRPGPDRRRWALPSLITKMSGGVGDRSDFSLVADRPCTVDSTHAHLVRPRRALGSRRMSPRHSNLVLLPAARRNVAGDAPHQDGWASRTEATWVPFRARRDPGATNR